MSEESKKLYLLTILSGKWRLVIIEQLFEGEKQFTDLKGSIAVSSKVLNDNLQFLVKNGIIKRCSYPTFPPKVQYSLSERGEKLRPILDSIYQWSLANYTTPTEKTEDKFYSLFK